MDTCRVPSNGCLVSSKVIPQVQLVIPPGAVEENASIGLQVKSMCLFFFFLPFQKGFYKYLYFHFKLFRQFLFQLLFSFLINYLFI